MDETQTAQRPWMKFDEECRELRHYSREWGRRIRHLMDHPVFAGEGIGPGQDHGEMRANIMLAYRHLEDVAMRLGKAIQAFDGGVSIYDK